MKKNLISRMTFFIVLAICFQPSAAQFPLKMPKLPKVEKPRPEQAENGNGNVPETREVSSRTEQPKKSNANRIYGVESKPARPRFIPDSVYIQAKTSTTYWKMPGKSDYTSWVPGVRFNVFYGDEDKTYSLNYTAEYINPDGSVWFTEELKSSNSIDAQGWLSIDSDRDVTTKMLETKASVTAGIYGVKITHKDSGEKIFQGKFKVSKLLRPYSERTPNRFEFFVEHDWHLPIGYVGFHFSNFTSEDVNGIGGFPVIVSTWLKGDVNASDLEARLFYKGQQIAVKQSGSTDGRFWAEKASGFAAVFDNQPIWKLWNFEWETFRFDNGGRFNRDNYPNAHYADKNPGEYTVKVFLKGTQIRELKFTVQPDGKLADGGFSKQIYLPYHKVIVPVKVMGNLEKWNATAWKTDIFYGNPPSGFTVQ